ncbi:MAG: tetratricopeptide repeat protein [Desulfobacca sp.]|nr:tetratricopeptide repeat protein [Desulfobacca sp.]
MRHMHKWVGFSVIAILGAVCLCMALASPTTAQPRPMAEDIFTPLIKGYDFMKEGKYDAAQEQFESVIKADVNNPFANNNLAVIMERQGKMQEALSYLKQGATHAKDYYNQLQQICFPGGLCYAARPVKKLGTESAIAPIISENIKRLEAKMGPKPEDIPAKIPPMEKKGD